MRRVGPVPPVEGSLGVPNYRTRSLQRGLLRSLPPSGEPQASLVDQPGPVPLSKSLSTQVLSLPMKRGPRWPWGELIPEDLDPKECFHEPSWQP